MYHKLIMLSEKKAKEKNIFYNSTYTEIWEMPINLKLQKSEQQVPCVEKEQEGRITEVPVETSGRDICTIFILVIASLVCKLTLTELYTLNIFYSQYCNYASISYYKITDHKPKANQIEITTKVNLNYQKPQ